MYENRFQRRCAPQAPPVLRFVQASACARAAPAADTVPRDKRATSLMHICKYASTFDGRYALDHLHHVAPFQHAPQKLQHLRQVRMRHPILLVAEAQTHVNVWNLYAVPHLVRQPAHVPMPQRGPGRIYRCPNVRSWQHCWQICFTLDTHIFVT